MEYNFTEIEKNWQRIWKQQQTYRVAIDSSRPKFYVLDMFPYPSGSGLHVGHPLGYIASDIYSRFKKLKGFNVLHPMGYDAFGLPAEQYAIQTGQHPAITTANNIKRYREQLDRLGLSYDWNREVQTCDPSYYKWTQWIFLQLFDSWFNNASGKAERIERLVNEFRNHGNNTIDAACSETTSFTALQWNAFSEKEQQLVLLKYRLAFLSNTMVNWCPALGTVLANEEVKDGVSERGGYPVERKLMNQWSLRISAYAERLLNGLDGIDWSESLKEAQRNWIGKSEGALVHFKVASPRPSPKVDEFASPQPSPKEREDDDDEPSSVGKEDKIYRWQTAQPGKYRSIKDHSRDMRKNNTPAEKLLWSKLRNSLTGFKFRRQHAIGPFIADFVCLSCKLVIELDGKVHENQKEYDERRDEYFVNEDYQIIRFKNEEILENTEVVVNQILHVIRNQKILSFGEDLGEAKRNVLDSPLTIPVFTTRPDTIFGVSFITLAPEHELVNVITTREYAKQVDAYITYAKNRSERERMADVKKITGQFTGAYVMHPFTGEEIPVWIGDYVLAGYGTGAVMAVPAHDSRDYAFAKFFNLPIKEVVAGGDISKEAYEVKDGSLINSDFLNGLTPKNAITKAIDAITLQGHGEKRINYRLRDAVFGRQRYWGEPIPVYYKDGIPYPLPEEELPLILPEVDKFLPTETGEPPLGRARNWKYKGEYDYELTTMPGWAGSSWYFLRYMDATNENEFASAEALKYWKEVDLYLGGSEHATGHLLYVRFWTKFLFDLGYIPVDEPAKKLINQGMIQGISCFAYRVNGTQKFVSFGLRDKYETTAIHVDVNMVHNSVLDIEAFRQWREEFASAEFITENGKYICGTEVEKMSKSKWNVVSPDAIIDQYGTDCLRMYEMFLGPIEQSKPWNTNGITGVSGFLKKFWKLFFRGADFEVVDASASPQELKILHKTIKKVTEDMERFSFNTSVSTFMICVNELTDLKCNKREILEPLTILIAPFAPHLSEELWSRMGHKNSIVNATYPLFNEKHLIENEFEYPVSINGKTRFKITLALNLSKEEVEKEVLKTGEMIKYLNENTIKKVIVVPGRIVNVVI